MTDQQIAELSQWIQTACSKTEFGEVSVSIVMHAGVPRKTRTSITVTTQGPQTSESSAPVKKKNRP